MSSRDMLEDLINGERNSDVLAMLPRGVRRSKIPALVGVLTGRFKPRNAWSRIMQTPAVNLCGHLDVFSGQGALSMEPVGSRRRQRRAGSTMAGSGSTAGAGAAGFGFCACRSASRRWGCSVVLPATVRALGGIVPPSLGFDYNTSAIAHSDGTIPIGRYEDTAEKLAGLEGQTITVDIAGGP